MSKKIFGFSVMLLAMALFAGVGLASPHMDKGSSIGPVVAAADMDMDATGNVLGMEYDIMDAADYMISRSEADPVGTSSLLILAEWPDGMDNHLIAKRLPDRGGFLMSKENLI